MITHIYDLNGDLVIHTAQGVIVISEHQQPHCTRVVMSPTNDGFVSTSKGKPGIMAMWAGVEVVESVEGEVTQS